MSDKKEDKGQASDRMQAAALTAATKGLSRAQADRVKAAAARNVNAYGQKEEGPSRWQERKEAKRQMYLRSTEKAVKLGVRKDKANDVAIGGVASQCQKCFKGGHWTYECKNDRVYVSRPSRSQLLKNPKLRQKIMSSYSEDNPDINGKEEKEEKMEKRRKKSKRKHMSDTESSSDTEASDSGSDSRSSSVTGSDYSSDEDASSYSSYSESEEDRRKKRRNNKKQKGRRKKYSSSSESSDYDSSSGSDSKRKRSKSKKRSSKR